MITSSRQQLILAVVLTLVASTLIETPGDGWDNQYRRSWLRPAVAAERKVEQARGRRLVAAERLVPAPFSL